MAYFNRGNSSRSGGFGGRPRQRRNDRGFGRDSFGGGRNREMFHAVCANCGKDCEVPFNPTGSKPVLCNDCFKSDRPTESRRGGQRSEPSVSKKQFEMLEAKLNRILTLLGDEPEMVQEKKKKKHQEEAPVEPVADTLDITDQLEVAPAPTEEPQPEQ